MLNKAKNNPTATINPVNFRHRTIKVSTDRIISTYLDEFLIKGRGVGDVIWIPKTAVKQEQRTTTVYIDNERLYPVGQLCIANAIRLFINQCHQIKGREVLF